MENQPDINVRMRGILVDWLIEVSTETTLVWFLGNSLVIKPLLCAGALQVLAHGRDSLPHNQPHRHVSCEVSVPVVDDLIVISDKAYTRREVLDMEKLMANTLQFNFCLPTPYVFMRRFLKAAQSNKKVELLSFFIIELCLVEYEMLQCVPSDVPGLFQTRFQTAPLDLDTKSFYLTRKETIESQLEKVANRMAEEMLIISYETHCGTTCRGVAWERFSLEGLKAAVACVGDKCVALIKNPQLRNSHWTIQKGSFLTKILKLYKGTLENGTKVAIRCLPSSKKYSIRNLKLRLDLLAKLRHPNLVCLLGHCIDCGGKDDYSVEKVFLIYEYIPNGNFQSCLSDDSWGKAMNWSERLTVLTGVAKAVHYLHTGVIPGFFSNRLKTNNVLLNQHRFAKLSDYGLSIVSEATRHNTEIAKSWQMSRLEDDVYSFGLILLQAIVGPSVSAREEAFLRDELASLESEEGRRRMVNPTVQATCRNGSLIRVIALMNKCVSPESLSRPSFEDILWNLQYASQLQAEDGLGHSKADLSKGVNPSVTSQEANIFKGVNRAVTSQEASLESEEGRRRMVNPTVQATCRNGSLIRVIALMNKCVSPESLSRPSFEDILWNLQYASQLQAEDGDRKVRNYIFSKGLGHFKANLSKGVNLSVTSQEVDIFKGVNRAVTSQEVPFKCSFVKEDKDIAFFFTTFGSLHCIGSSIVSVFNNPVVRDHCLKMAQAIQKIDLELGAKITFECSSSWSNFQ
ncbi:hypothetical protein F2Q68_00018988 [Brassica cretica]|uniref:Protein kinase domain-containing protein n=1 Tax=Brassica cretica TaxID=69181 RepID=A0A8S9FVU4_BRACR|nr:hypothetical protein F2Q68_00018988 [Brassica cretica]